MRDRSLLRLALPATLILGAALQPLTPSALGQTNASPPKLTYTRLLRGSVPEWQSITVDATGNTLIDIRMADDPPAPRPAKLSPATIEPLFSLARCLNYFRNVDVESHLKVANLGKKTLVYEAGEEKNEVEFNFTRHRCAEELTERFERISRLGQHLTTLEYDIKYDPLGLSGHLALLQSDLNRKSVAEPELLVPVLEQIARNTRFLNHARTRAQRILDRLNPQP